MGILMMVCLCSSCLVNEICSIFRFKSNLKSGVFCSWLCMYVGFYVIFFGVAFSSITLLLHFSSHIHLSLRYLPQCPLLWNMCYTTNFLSLIALTSRFLSNILYIFGRIYIFSKLMYSLRVFTQIQVHCLFVFSVIFCIYAFDSTKHSGIFA